jgi:uncharacterized protein (TIGR02271 family)
MRAVVGLFESGNEARRAIDELVRLGFRPQGISVVTNLSTKSEFETGNRSAGFQKMTLTDVGAVAASGPLTTQERRGERSGLAGMLERLGLSSAVAAHFVRGIGRGGTLESMIVDDADAERVAAVMNRRHTGPRTTETTGVIGQAVGSSLEPGRFGARHGQGHAFTEEQQTIPVYREELRVGKREVERGGVRLTTHVVEKPYAEDIVLREEHVDVERRSADRLRRPEQSQFSERQIEMAEIGEEAIGAKQTRLVEEIVVRKHVGERTATVGDNLRSMEVDVRPLGASIEREPGVAAGAPAPSRWALILLPTAALPVAVIGALVFWGMASRTRGHARRRR